MGDQERFCLFIYLFKEALELWNTVYVSLSVKNERDMWNLSQCLVRERIEKRMGDIFIDSIREGYEGSLGEGFTKRKDHWQIKQ